MSKNTRFIEQPFIYAFSPQREGLTNGNDYNNLEVSTDRNGGQFILRRIANADNASSSFRVQGRNARYLSNSFLAAQADWPCLPQQVYQPGDSILFDLEDVNSIGAWNQLCFQGVRRFENRINPLPGPPITGNKYYERFYQYVAPINLVVPPNTAAEAVSQIVSLEVRNAPFVLRRILIVNTATGASGTAGLSLLFKDANQCNLMNIPIYDNVLAYNSQSNWSVFPVPELIYPIGSELYVTAFNADPTSEGSGDIDAQIIFDGAWMLPCA